MGGPSSAVTTQKHDLRMCNRYDVCRRDMMQLFCRSLVLLFSALAVSLGLVVGNSSWRSPRLRARARDCHTAFTDASACVTALSFIWERLLLTYEVPREEL